MANLPSPRAQLIDAIHGLLTEQGAMDPDEIIDAIEAQGISVGAVDEDLIVDLLESDETPLIRAMSDGRCVLLPALLADRTFTHRVTAHEIQHDLLVGGETLSPLLVLLHDAQHGRLVDGGRISVILSPLDLPPDREDAPELLSDSAVRLPPGTLAALDVSEDDLVGVRLTSGGINIVRISDVEMPPADIGSRILALLMDDPDVPVDIDELVWQLCADDRQLLRDPLPPLPELFDMLRLPHEDGLVAVPGFDFTDWHIGEITMEICERYDLHPEEATTVVLFASTYDAMRSIAEDAPTTEDGASESYQGMLDDFLVAPDELADLSLIDQLALLARPQIADAAFEEVRPVLAAAPELMLLLLDMLRPMLPRATWPALGWMRAKTSQEMGATADAQAALVEAESLDPAWPLTLVELAQYASDRGDAADALALMRRAGAHNGEFSQLLQRFQSASRPEMRRNQPCWCGSGRKYKMCHLGREQLPLEERATWLYTKATMHLDTGRWRDRTVEAVLARLAHRHPDTAPGELMADGLIMDTVLFEGGGLQDFLAVRGELLPEDERLLAEQWVRTERSLYEVERVRRGVGLELRDVRTGDQFDVKETTVSKQIKAGTLICTHVLPAGDRHLIFGGIEQIRPEQRGELIALLGSNPEPPDVVDFLSRPSMARPGSTIDLTDRQAVPTGRRPSAAMEPD
jgi:hypothetical protein